MVIYRGGGDDVKDRLKELRKSLGLTQKDFAQRIGASPSVLNNYECGRRKPPKVVVNNICKTFSVSEQWLRTGEGPMMQEGELDAVARFAAERGLDPADYVFLEKYLALPQEQRAAALGFILDLAAALAGVPLPGAEETEREARQRLEEQIRQEAEEEAELYKRQRILEKRREAGLSALNTTGDGSGAEAG